VKNLPGFDNLHFHCSGLSDQYENGGLSSSLSLLQGRAYYSSEMSQQVPIDPDGSMES